METKITVMDIAFVFANVGVYLANCDQNFDEKERAFIEKYTDELRANNIITDEDVITLKKVSTKVVSKEDALSLTNSIYAKLTNEDKKVFERNMKKFVNELAKVDNVVTKEEKEFIQAIEGVFC